MRLPAVAALIALTASAVACRGGERVRNATKAIRNDGPWPMHAVDSRFRGANALFPADVDRDGRTDYVTNYEFDQRYVVAFHPGARSDLVRPWPTMTFLCPTAVPGRGCDTESAMAADLDGDGNLDLVGAQGGHPTAFFDGDEPGVRVIWGPPKQQARNSSAWRDGGRFPATIGRGHFLWVLPHDLNGDGAVDVLAGGRIYFRTGRPAGIVWLEAPASQQRRRDLGAWTLHEIDPSTPGGHGFVLVDLDGDGDKDIVDANADFDTPEDQESLAWYENPGAGGSGPWRRTELLRDPGFFGKPQIGVGDVDGDRLTDLVTQTVDDYLFLLRRPGRAVHFDVVRVPKPSRIRWATRSLRLADIDGDGRLDVVGMLTHDDGRLPSTKASAYWMRVHDLRAGRPRLEIHVIKWSSGRTAALNTFGEKWDQLDVRDVDGDGDPDIVANDEEWMQQPSGEITPFDRRHGGEAVSIVWFENRLRDEPWTCREDDGVCVLEGERPTRYLDGSWIERNQLRGAHGGAYLQAFNAVRPSSCPELLTPEETFRDCPRRIDDVLAPDDTTGARWRAALRGGRYDVWLRMYAPAQFGNGLGGSRSDSAWLSLDARKPVVAGDALAPDRWTWVRAFRDVPLTKGAHNLELRVRERGVAIDRIVVAVASAPTAQRPPGMSP